MASGLNADERETVILGSDSSEIITVWTAQRPNITRLQRNPGATEIESGFYGTTAWAKFELPAELVSFRKPRRPLTVEQRRAKSERARRNFRR